MNNIEKTCERFQRWCYSPTELYELCFITLTESLIINYQLGGNYPDSQRDQCNDNLGSENISIQNLIYPKYMINIYLISIGINSGM